MAAVVLAMGVGIVAESVRAQTAPEWRWSNPQPHGNNVADLVLYGTTYLEVTDHGGIYTSGDRLNWVRRSSGTTRALRAAAFSGSRLVITGEEGTVLWTEDGVRFQAGTVSPATTDWLEGVAGTTNLWVAVGDNAAIYRSTNGVAWGRVTGSGLTQWLTGVAYGGGLFVAVGDGGLVVTSPNGTTWTRRTTGVTNDLARVTYGDGRFLAVGRRGMVLTSTNGTTWSTDTVGTTNSLFAAVLTSGERLVVGESAFYLRKPPVVWQDQTSSNVTASPVPVWTYAAALWDGQRYVAAGRTGVFVESFRTNSGPLAGSTFWFRNDDTARNWLSEVTRRGDVYLAVGDVGTILSSANGVAWNLEGAPVLSDTILYGIGGSTNRLVAVGSEGTLLTSLVGYTNQVVTNGVVIGEVTHRVFTTNRVGLAGVVWDAVASPTTQTLQGVGWDGTRYLVTGAAGTVLTSSDGLSWAASTIAGAGFLSSVTPYRGGWVASGGGGAIYGSTNAVNWVKRNSGTTNWVYRVRDVGGGLVGVGQNGTLLTSDDGIAWVSRVSGTDAWLTDALGVGGATYVCGTAGTVLRSVDRVNWSVVAIPTGKALYGLASDGVQMVTVGDEGVVLRSLVAADAAPVGIAGYGYFPATGGELGGEGLVFRGTPEQPFRVQGVDDVGGAWSDEAGLELDANGAAVLGRVAEAGEVRRLHRTAAP